MSRQELATPRNMGIGAMATPLLIVAALVLLNGASEPKSSAAAVQPPRDPASASRASLGALDPAQQSALRFSEQIPELTESDSPFPPIESIRSQVREEIDPDAGLAPPTAGPTFTVSAVMASNAGAIALIDGKAHREGDVLPGGWVIREIDAQAKRVVLVSDRDEKVTLGLNRPMAMPNRSR
jgi:hypothetical protein